MLEGDVHRSTTSKRGWGFVYALLALAALIGAGFRTLAVFDPSSEFPRGSPIIEDAYYSLTVSRNLARGNGFTADGKHLTNGVQPLTTVLAALAFLPTSRDDRLSIRLFMAFSLAISFVNALLVGTLSQLIVQDRTALYLGAAVYLLWPVAFHNDLNGLETGVTTCLLLASLASYRFLDAGKAQGSRVIGFGVLWGLLALSRIDGLVTLALFVTLRWILALRRDGSAKFGQSCVFSSVALLVASPWLLYNWSVFGSFIPVSGHASMGKISEDPLGGVTFCRTVEALWDNPFLYPIETGFRRLPENVLLHIGILAVWLAGIIGALIWRSGAADEGEGEAFRRFVVYFSLLHLIVMACVYGSLFYTSRYFIQRYLYPSTVLTIPLALYTVWPLILRTNRLQGSKRAVFPTVLAIYIAFYVVSGVRWLGKPANDEFYDLAAYLQRTFPLESIAMFQSGTVGFLLENVTNLDGKVNAEVREYLDKQQLATYLARKRFDVIAAGSRTESVGLGGLLEKDYTRSQFGRFVIFSRRSG
jgi:4-amino-4-deoxy-L-arabinose transferase-like glycosyltransferase